MDINLLRLSVDNKRVRVSSPWFLTLRRPVQPHALAPSTIHLPGNHGYIQTFVQLLSENQL